MVDLLPWQRELIDRLLERNPETGEYVHTKVVVSAPRFTPKFRHTDLRPFIEQIDAAVRAHVEALQSVAASSSYAGDLS